MDTLDLLLHECRQRSRKESKESFKVGYRLVEIIKSLASSGATRWTEGKGRLGLGASDSRQKRCDACIVQIKSTEQVQVHGLIYSRRDLLSQRKNMVERGRMFR